MNSFKDERYKVRDEEYIVASSFFSLIIPFQGIP
jgi:hypothetical protein